MRKLPLLSAAFFALLLFACNTKQRTPADHILGDWYIDTAYTQTYFNGTPGTGSRSIITPYNLLFDGNGFAYFIKFNHTDTTRFQILDEHHIIMDLNADQKPDSVFVDEYQYQKRIYIYGVTDQQYPNGNIYQTVTSYSLSR